MPRKLSAADEIRKIADALRPKLRRQFLDAVGRIKDNASLTRIANEIKAGRIQGVMEALGLEAEFLAFQVGALKTARTLVEQAAAVAPLPKGVSVSFDLTNPKVFEVIRKDTINAVLQITKESEAAVRVAIERSFREGIPTLQTAREIRDLVGLTQNQWKTVGRYDEYIRGLAERFTEIGDLSKTAEYKLRRGGMKTLVGENRGLGVLNRTGLTDARIETLVQKYTDKLLAERAEMIARTLTIEASNEGQERLWQQAVEEGEIDKEDWDVTWITAEDDRSCQDCLDMDGEIRPMDGPFESGPFAGDYHPPGHPNCRCSTGLQRKEGKGVLEQLAAMNKAA